MSFRPPHCPHPDCPSIHGAPFLWQQKGCFHRACDGRTVPRFRCKTCRRGFSLQTFRVDYRLKLPKLHLALFGSFVSKTTHRQAARMLGCSRHTVMHRLRLLGEHCRDFHAKLLEQARSRGGIKGIFQLDELETFEQARKLAPVTMPVLIERKSFFVLHTSAAPLPARGRLSAHERARKLEREKLFGKRKSGSREAVKQAFGVLKRAVSGEGRVVVQTDQKSSYATLLAERFGDRVVHERHSSTKRRDHANPLSPINHTLAMMRDGVSRLVRRNWGHAKLRERLEKHAWIWVAYRNYVRGITNHAKRITPAMALGVHPTQLNRRELFTWRVFPGR